MKSLVLDQAIDIFALNETKLPSPYPNDLTKLKVINIIGLIKPAIGGGFACT